MDRWMLERTADLVKKCREWYANYEFHRAYHAIHDYCVVDLSAFYYDVLKDRLYTKAPNNPRALAQFASTKSGRNRLARPMSRKIWSISQTFAVTRAPSRCALISEEADCARGNC